MTLRQICAVLFVVGSAVSCVSGTGEPGPDPSDDDNDPSGPSGGGNCACDVDFTCSSGCSCDTECGSGTSSDSGSEFASCSCDAVPGSDPDEVTRCSGSDDGCEGFGLTGDLACFALTSTGQGTCHFPCSANQEGTQGSCPSGYTCVPTVETDAAGNS